METWRPVRSDFVFNTGNLEMQRLNTGLPGYKLKDVPGLANVIRDGMKPLYRGDRVRLGIAAPRPCSAGARRSGTADNAPHADSADVPLDEIRQHLGGAARASSTAGRALRNRRPPSASAVVHPVLARLALRPAPHPGNPEKGSAAYHEGPVEAMKALCRGQRSVTTDLAAAAMAAFRCPSPSGVRPAGHPSYGPPRTASHLRRLPHHTRR